jgi:hypothetical protein
MANENFDDIRIDDPMFLPTVYECRWHKPLLSMTLLALFGDCDPEMKSLMAILKAMGMRLGVEPIETAHA